MKKVLLVEDTPSLAENISDILQNLGFVVTLAENGIEGLHALKTAPDLIITDVFMPAMDGLEFIKAIRKLPEWSSIPIIVLSAKATPEDIKLGKHAGANAYLTNPCTAEELIDAISKLIQL